MHYLTSILQLTSRRMEAIVYKSTGSWYVVKTNAGRTFNARIKGIFKMDELTSTNPVAVGDKVKIEPDAENENIGIISEISERKNYIVRSSPHQNKQRHIIASNLDKVFIFASLKNPKTSQGFIDRFLIAAEASHIPSIIVFNKFDLYTTKEMAKFNELNAMYSQIGYQIFLMSMQTGSGVVEIKNMLKDRTTLLCGHSGVGKSTFLNYIFPDLNLRTNKVSGWSGKGLHTTTFAEMFDLPFGGKVIDTPGIREFGVIDIAKQELSHYFIEMRGILNNCQFNNCLHINEPGCAIKEAINKGKISIERYISYCNILDSIDEKNY